MQNFFPEVIASSSFMDRHIASSAVSLDYKYGFSIQAAFSGPSPGPTGTLYLQGSNDFKTPTTWTQIDGSVVNINGSSGTVLWNSQLADYRWVQMRWIASTAGSSGILTAFSCAKGY